MPAPGAVRQTEEELVKRFQAGEEAAFDLLVASCAPQVQGLVTRMLGDADDVDDVTQEIFIQLYRALPRFKGAAAFFTFLYRIVKNTCVTALRKRRRRLPVLSEITTMDGENASDVLDGMAPQPSAETTVLLQERRQAVYWAVMEIPEHYRTVYILSEIAGYADQQIADTLRLSLGTVKSRLNRARAHFRKTVLAHRELFVE